MRWVLVFVAALAALPAQAGGDGPEISRTRGKAGGAVVLWPRLVPEAQDPVLTELAGKLQQRLEVIARRSVSETKTLVRPAPERACPIDGCRGVSVGVLLGHEGGGCVAVALVGPPGTEPTELVPWAGKIRTPSSTVAFRQAPEAAMVVTEFVPCEDLLTQLDDAAVEAAVARAVPAS